MGAFDKLEEFMNDRDEIKTRNFYLQPVYRRLKESIRNMTYTEEAKAYLDYNALKNRIENYYVQSYNSVGEL